MFTGIVEEQGHILAAETHHTRDNTLTIAARTALIGTAIGLRLRPLPIGGSRRRGSYHR